MTPSAFLDRASTALGGGADWNGCIPKSELDDSSPREFQGMGLYSPEGSLARMCLARRSETLASRAMKRATDRACLDRCCLGKCLSAFKSAGLDDKTIELLCSGMSAAEFAEEKKVCPQLSMCLKFRSAPDQPCVQEYALET